MNALSKLFEVLHLSRGEMTLRKSHRRRRARRQGSALSCETLEPKQLLAADVAVQFSDIVLDTTDPVTVALEGTFEDTAVSGTVVKFETNAPLTDNDFYVELTSNTPLTNANFLSYVNSGAYDNSKFHRSVSDFVLQGGGFKHPTVSADQPGSDPVAIPTTGTVQNEPGNLNTRGTIAMAKLGGQPDSATSQFFFNLSENSFLDSDNGGYTAFGDVLGSGMTVVDTMGSALTYDAQTYYSNTALSDLPLWNINQDNIVQPQDFVKIENADVVTESALMTYTVTSSDTAKLAASFDSNGDLVLTPVGSATGSVDVTVTATSRLDNSTASDTFSVQLNGGDDGPTDPVLTLLEGLGNTTLYEDENGLLYASAGGPEAAIQLKLSGEGFSKNVYSDLGWNIVGGENRNGTNTLLLQNAGDGRFWIWTFDVNWEWQSGSITRNGKGAFFDAELDFSIDGNGDGVNGLSYKALQRVTTTQNMAGQLYANGQAIMVGANQLASDTYNDLGWTFQGAESVGETNQVIFTNTANKIWKWTLDATWNWQSGEIRTSGEARYFDAEIDFQIDADNSGAIGFARENNGSTFLATHSDGRVFVNGKQTMLGNDEITIDYYGSLGWTIVRAEVNYGLNQLLLSNTDGRLWSWTMDADWNWLSGKALSDTAAKYFNAELDYGYDGNGDGVIGQTFEQIGQVTMASNSAGQLFVDGSAVKAGRKILKADTYAAQGWTVNGAESVNGTNTVLFTNPDGRVWKWTLNSNWEYERGRVYGTGSYKFWNAEINFQIDVDGDGFRGSPLDGAGDTSLSMDDANSLLLNNSIFVTVGTKTLTRQFYAKVNWYVERAEVIDGKNMMLFKNSVDNRLWVWNLSESWSWESNVGVFDSSSSDYFAYETLFSIDANGNGIGT